VPLELPGPAVSTDWLASHLADRDLVVVDGSWYLPAMQRDAKAEYRSGHIPGAVFWDIDVIADRTTSLPHMLPSLSDAPRLIGGLGIGRSSAVVAYDGSGNNLSAARIWWTLRVFGHDRVAVLDGGIGKWRREGRPLESGEVRPNAAEFVPRFRPALVRSLGEVAAALETRTATVVDARGPGRFEGSEPEPRPGVRSGHMPGARNLPFGSVVDGEGVLLDATAIRERFEEAGVDLAEPVILSCGSGVSACALALGLERAGHRDYAVYDGSWTEWGGHPSTPVVSGPS